METIHPESWKQDLPAFREKTAAFYAGELDKAAYKGFSGLYGSYAQKGGNANMLRLRMTAGRVTPEKLVWSAASTGGGALLQQLPGLVDADIFQAAVRRAPL